MVIEQVADCAATGRRKTAVARVQLKPGEGRIRVNGKDLAEFFPTVSLRRFIEQPLRAVEAAEKWDARVTVSGGGPAGQAGAVRHGIARALVVADPNLRAVLKSGGFLTRDSRMKERKKPGQPGARKRFQFSKR